jgi:hypothetical protein
VALVCTRMSGLRPVVNREQLAVLRILVDRRRWLGADHTRMIAQLHQLLLELIPGGAKKSLSAAWAEALPARVRPRDTVGKTRRRVAAELVADLERVYRRAKQADKELTELVAATGTTLLDLHGIGPSGAARLLVEVADITRFPTGAHFCVLQRHRTHCRLLRRPGPPPARAGRQPADQPGAAHHGHRCAAHRHRRPRLRRPQEGIRQDPDGGDALPETTPVPTSSTDACSTTPSPTQRQAREGNQDTTLTPARPVHIPTPALRTSHFPDPPPTRLRHHLARLVDTEGSHDRTFTRQGLFGRAAPRGWTRAWR